MRLLILCVAWLAGMASAAATPLTALNWLVLAAASLIPLIISKDSRPARFLFGMLLMLCLGAGRQELFQASFSPPELVRYNDFPQSVQVVGTIIDFPERRDQYTALILQTEIIQTGSGPMAPVSGKILARADQLIEWKYGDRVELQGRLETPPEFEDFSYRDYLARQGIHSLMQVDEGRRLEPGRANPILGVIYHLRSRAHFIILKIFPEPEASLLSGILLGLESGIPPEIRAAFDRTGTTHIIAISGFNITIIAGIFLGIGRRWLGARWGALAAAFAISGYSILVGADAAVVRAAVMAFVSLLALRIGRQTDGLAALGAAAVVMTATNPPVLADVGFQLSMAATLGLLLFAGPMTESFIVFLGNRFDLESGNANRWVGSISEYFTVTLAAQLTTLPLLVFHFHRLSIISPLANLLILPAQPAVMILAGLATIAGFIWLQLGQWLAWLAWPLAAFTINTVRWLSGLSIANLNTPPISMPMVIGLYMALAIFLWFSKKTSLVQEVRGSFNVPWPMLIITLLVLNFLAWRLLLDQPDGRLHLTVLDTGGQPGVLIQTPDGRRVLIDGGPSAIALGSSLDTRMSPFHRKLDWILLSQVDDESAAGIAGLIERYQIGGALIIRPSRGHSYQTIATKLNETGRPVGILEEGQIMALGDGGILRIIQLEAGSAMELKYGRARILMGFGKPKDWLSHLPPASRRPGMSALLLPASGDASITPPDQVIDLQPQVVVLTVEAGEARGLPASSLLDSFVGRPVLRTDKHGWIELVTDGRQLWVELERPLDLAAGRQPPFQLRLLPRKFIHLSMD